MRPLILGMADPSGSGEALAIDGVPAGASGVRLWKMSGLSREEWLAAFDRTNVVPDRRWLRYKARHLGVLARTVIGDRTTVVLGRETWLALGLRPAAPLARVANFYRVPHPSGRNPWYNDIRNRSDVGRLLRRLAREGGLS